MTLWRRASREVYRVYGQDEYLATDDLPVQETLPSPSRGEDAHAPHPGRLLGLGILVGVTVGVLALVVLNVSRRLSAAPRSAVAQRAGVRAGVRPPRQASTHPSVRVASATQSAVHPIPHPASRSSASGSESRRPLSHGDTHTGAALNVALVEPGRDRIATSELPAHSKGAPIIDGEFDFER